MRLIDVTTRKLVLNPKNEKGRDALYGVMSHRWGRDEDEVTFGDMQLDEWPLQKKGFYKIDNCCKQAERDGLKYLWVDTCCIDKSSSAELQEAINSMFSWYENARSCYVYLSDVRVGPGYGSLEDIELDEWFTRGWTLQELLAPSDVKFYDCEWRELGDKRSLKKHIHTVTKISIDLLEGKTSLRDYSIAERMSWASDRVTRLVEDQAYSLLGIFQVNMPMVYGEGQKAFIRLQEEIIKSSDDHSIFAWKGVKTTNPGLLAPTLANFKDCGNIKTVRGRKSRSSYMMTNRGVEITLNLTPWTIDTYLAFIYCTQHPIDAATSSSKWNEVPLLGIFLRKLAEDDQYARVKVNGEDFFSSSMGVMTLKTLETDKNVSGNRLVTKDIVQANRKNVQIHVRQTEFTKGESSHSHDTIYGWRICEELIEYDNKNQRLFSTRSCQDDAQELIFDDQEGILFARPGSSKTGTLGSLDVRKQKKKFAVIKLGFDWDFNPVVFLAEPGAVDQKLKSMADLHGTDYEKSASKSLDSRSPDDSVGWNALLNVNGQIMACEHLRDGLYAFKGDRVNGINIWLADNIHVIAKKVLTSQRLIWHLQIDGLKKSGWRWRPVHNIP